MVISAMVGVSLASEAAFLSFAKTFNKKYDTAEEFHKRMQIFEVGWCVLCVEFWGQGLICDARPTPRRWRHTTRGTRLARSAGGGVSRSGRTRASNEPSAKFSQSRRRPLRTFSWLKATTSTFIFKTLLRHFAKQVLTPRKLDMKLEIEIGNWSSPWLWKLRRWCVYSSRQDLTRAEWLEHMNLGTPPRAADILANTTDAAMEARIAAASAPAAWSWRDQVSCDWSGEDRAHLWLAAGRRDQHQGPGPVRQLRGLRLRGRHRHLLLPRLRCSLRRPVRAAPHGLRQRSQLLWLRVSFFNTTQHN